MDIEEIKCPLCSLIYDENDHVPILLPDCGHSFCSSCIHECYELMKMGAEENNNDSLEETTPGDESQGTTKKKFVFRCPEDE